MGIKSTEITDIIITHPHFDHIGGIVLFPSAQVWMQKDDYDYFVGAAWQKNGFNEGFNKEDVKNIVAKNLEGKLTLIKGDSIEIFPGIRAFIGSKHTWESQHLLVNTKTDKVILASDDCWFYYNVEHLLPITHYLFDPDAYVKQLKRMRVLQPNISLIIPGHDPLVFSKFPKVAEGIVKIR
jgi:glyoxylase-like metal-dependent hydrolase (beta-lactamase superfamily II)